MLKLETFVKLMMMTTSDKDGEALTAIRKANLLLKAEGKNWEELITGLVPIEREARFQEEAPRRSSGKAPPWDDDEDWKKAVPRRGAPEYQTFMYGLFEEALSKVRTGTSFRNTIESIHQWWQDKGFVTDNQLKVVLKAAGRIAY
jgi:hypothetical protein